MIVTGWTMWVLSAIVAVALVEVALRLPFPRLLNQASRSGRGALFILSSRSVSDHWKEKAMLTYAGLMFSSSLALALSLAVLLAVAGILVLAIDRIASGFAAFFLSAIGILGNMAMAVAYLAARSRLRHGRL